MGFDNTKDIKRMIVDGHKRGVCDSDGNTNFIRDIHGNRRPIARPTFGRYPSSAIKTYVCRDGKMVLKG